MAITAAPFALKNLGLDAEPLRQAVASLVPNGGGLVQPGDLLVTQTGVLSLGVLIGVGRCWMPGTNTSNLSGQTYSTQGQYFATNDAPFTLNLTTADPTNPRIDLVYIGAVDTFYGGGSNVVKIDKVVGTPAASPVVPTLPPNSIALGQVAVAANATTVANANITNVAMPYSFRSAAFAGPAVNSGVNSITSFGAFTVVPAATYNNDFCQYNAVAGQIKILKSGVYTVSCGILPQTSPNTTSLRIRDTTLGEMVAVAVGGQYVTYETTCSGSRFITANTILEFTMITTNSVLTGSNVHIVKVG